MTEEGSGGVEPLIKTEVPPPLVPSAMQAANIGGNAPADAGEQADKQQVQAAMAMAAFYSQSPLWQAAVAAREAAAAREEVQSRLHATVPHPAVAAFSHLPGRPSQLPGLGFPGLAGLASLSHHHPGLAPRPDGGGPLDHRQELYRDYLSKLAATTLNHSTSSSSQSATPVPTSSAKALRRSSSPGGDIRRASPLSINPFLQANASYFSMPPSQHTSPESGGGGGGGGTKSYTRSPPGSGRGGRNGSTVAGRDKVFTCKICNRSFGYKHVLQNHERTHTGEKPFECKECHKRFTRDHHLKTHMRLHTGEKPYNCTHCDRQFVQVANLRRHLRVHTGERPYKCELCPNCFSDSNQLKAHMLIHKGQSLTSLKEELLFRHSLQAGGFPLPHYPAPPPLKAESDRTSLSPASKDTGSGDSPSHGENTSDSNSEKKRSRKQKPRRIAQWPEGVEAGGDSPGEYESVKRERHSSEFSGHHAAATPMQQEPEDLTVRPRLEALKEFHKKKMSEFSFNNYDHNDRRIESAADEVRPPPKSSAEVEDHFPVGDDFKIKLTANRSEERSEGGSSHSPPRGDKFNDEADDEDEEERGGGVSPPLSHGPPLYNPLFSGHSAAAAAIQLGLAGATMPLALPRHHHQRYSATEQDKDHLALLAQKEISQQ